MGKKEKAGLIIFNMKMKVNTFLLFPYRISPAAENLYRKLLPRPPAPLGRDASVFLLRGGVKPA